MKLDFVNRVGELAELDATAARGGLLVVFWATESGQDTLAAALDGWDASLPSRLQRWLDHGMPE